MLSFLLKSNIIKDIPDLAEKLVKARFKELIGGARSSIRAEGGRVFATAAACVNLLFLNSRIPATVDQPQLPFTVTVGDFSIVFDEVDPRPVFECRDNDSDSLASRTTASYTEPNDLSTATINAEDDYEDHVLVELNAGTAFQINVSHRILTDALSRCSMCYGYTLCGIRCKNMRRAVSGSVSVGGSDSSGGPVWCHHHFAQKRDFQRFLLNGERPIQGKWWEQYDYEELVMRGRKWTL